MSTNSKRHRILIVSPMLPAVGGISVSSSRLRDRLIDDGYEVDTYNLQMKVPGWCHGMWQLINTFWIPFYILFNKKYDIVHLHISCYWRRVYIWLTRWMFGRTKTVVTIHGDLANYINKPLCAAVLSSGDKLICVQPGNRKLLPEKLQSRAHEIPAFIMPTMEEILQYRLPSDVQSFVENSVSAKKPLILFNGSIVLSSQFYDLYGFADMTETILRLQRDGFTLSALIIVNDVHLDENKMKFLKKIEKDLSGCRDVLIYKFSQFSLLPIFNRKGVIYVRPTKTDGDSLSVREALALGRPVIASNVVPRPAGTITYNATSGVDALYASVRTLLSDKSNDQNVENCIFYQDFYPDILSIYNTL